MVHTRKITGTGFLVSLLNAMSVVVRLLRLSLLSVVALSALKGCAGSSLVSEVDLTVLPAVGQSVVEGGSFRIVCRVTRVSYPFDLVRIVRRIGDVEYEIATNGYLAERYRRTGRYKIVRWEDSVGLLEIEVAYVLGADGGNIGCRSLPDGQSKFQDVIVQVPLRKIELRYQLTDGTNNTLHTGQNIRFQRDLVRSVSCHVSVTGSDFGPEVVLMLDATDVTSLFEKRVVRGYGDSGGFVEAANSAEFKWIFDGNDGTWVEKVHGRNLTCIATMSMFPPIAASALVEAEHAPIVLCDAGISRRTKPGRAEHRLECRLSAFPQPERITWSWMDGNQMESLTWWTDGSGKNYSHKPDSHSNSTRFQIGVNPVGGDKYDVTLIISDVKPSDFRSYVLQIGNKLGATEVRVELLIEDEDVAMFSDTTKARFSTVSSTDAVPDGPDDLQPNLEMLKSSMTPAMTRMTPFVWMTSIGVMWLLGRWSHDAL